jgi:hypothetical protein
MNGHTYWAAPREIGWIGRAKTGVIASIESPQLPTMKCQGFWSASCLLLGSWPPLSYAIHRIQDGGID